MKGRRMGGREDRIRLGAGQWVGSMFTKQTEIVYFDH